MAYPRYLDAFKSGALRRRADEARALLEKCVLCPKKCGTNRLRGEHGFCRTGANAYVCSFFAHHGEEPPISGQNGSGTIFFSRCNLRCLYCQNHRFSQLNEGREVSAAELAGYMLKLQSLGCHNINFVTPTHVMPQILEALLLAAKEGLHLPLVYNSSGYDSTEALALLDGLIDIYLPDMRYADDAVAEKYSSAPGYTGRNRSAVKEMHRQVGEASFDEKSNIAKGLIVRHLVLPEDLGGTEDIFAFIAHSISRNTYVSLMSQYFPCFEAPRHPPLDRRLTLEEYERAVELLHSHGLHNGWVQESGGLRRFAGTNIKSNIT